MVWTDDCLLDDSRLDETRTLTRRVSPRRYAMLVDRTDIGDARAAIEYACQIWGGAATFLVPVDPSNGSADSAYLRTVTESDLEVARRGLSVVVGSASDNIKGLPPRVEPLLAIALSDLSQDKRTHVVVALPGSTDPWYVAYLATLGAWPATPTPALLEAGNFIPGLRFEDLLNLEFETVDAPSASDLLRRNQEPKRDRPVRASSWLLAPQPARWFPPISGEWRPPSRGEIAARTGPNIVVVYEPGSVADACLLWNLRAAHGLPPGLPLAVPRTSSTPDYLAELLAQGAINSPLFATARPVLTSATVAHDVLRDLAGGTWSVESVENLLQVPAPFVSPSSEIGVFRDGRATVPLWSSADRQLLGARPNQFGWFQLTASFNLADRPLPDVRSLRRQMGANGIGPFGFEFDLRRPDETNVIEWPCGWLVLEGAVRDRGFTLRRSTPGKAAEALIRRMGGLSCVDYLAVRPILDELNRLSERRAMSWFRQRLRDIKAGASIREASTVEVIESELEEHPLRPFENEQYDAAFRDFRRDLGDDRNAADLWVRWAEKAGVLIKGTEFLCGDCGLTSWRAIDEFGSPIVCRGCGRTAASAFGTENLEFHYRVSEPIVRAAEFDALPHLLAMRWFAALYRPFSQGSSRLYGMHPGVELLNQQGAVIAEVDLLLLFDDGALVPGEVKRTGAGLKQTDLDKLDAVVTALDSPWSFVATPDWASNCQPIWQTARRYGARPRFALNGEHLLSTRVIAALGLDPFAWRSDSDEERRARISAFNAFLRDAAAWKMATRVPGRFDWTDD